MARITATRLRELLQYDPATGLFLWLIRTSSRCFRGWFPGTINIAGGRGHSQRPYRRFKIDRKNYYAHDLAHLYMTGSWPPHQIDHKDIDTLNNAWANLRPATDRENKANRRQPICPQPTSEPLSAFGA